MRISTGLVTPLEERYSKAVFVSCLFFLFLMAEYNRDKTHCVLSDMGSEVRLRLSVLVSSCELSVSWPGWYVSQVFHGQFGF